MGMFDDIFKDIDEVVNNTENKNDSIGISEVEKSTGIWNSRDNGKAWAERVDPSNVWSSSRMLTDEDGEEYEDADVDEEYEDEDDEEYDGYKDCDCDDCNECEISDYTDKGSFNDLF